MNIGDVLKAKDAYIEKNLTGAPAPYKCLECGRRFKTATAAERAMSEGCPGCGGSDIDLA